MAQSSQHPSDPPDAPTGRLRIGAVVRLTGLSSHVIRVWERRYGAVVPHRTPGGTRLYDSGHVDRLNRLAALTRRGHAIGAIAGYADDVLAKLSAGTDAPASPGPVAAASKTSTSPVAGSI